jgi:flagellar motility protein MotE (MotC chaperone)
MKPLFKIGLFAAMIIGSFIMYVIVIGIGFGIQPGQAISAFMPAAEPEVDSIAADSVFAETDSANIADSVTTILTAPKNDSIADQLAQLDKKLNQMESLKSELNRMLAAKKANEDERLYSLAKMYEGVEASQLAQVFSKMEDSLVIAILPKMKAQKAGKILEFLPPERAAKISSLMLGKG